MRSRDSNRWRVPAPLGLLLLAAAAGSVAAGILVPRLSGALPGPAVVTTIVVLALVLLAALGALLCAGRHNLIGLPIMTALGFLFYPLGALTYATGQKDPSPLIPTFSEDRTARSFLLLALLLVIAALAAWAIGYWLFREREPATSQRSAAGAVSSVNRRRLALVVGAFTLIGALAFTRHYAARGGLYNSLATIAQYRGSVGNTSLWSWLALLMPEACLLWLGLDYEGARHSALFWPLFAISFLSLLSFGNRWTPAGFLLIAALVHYQYRGVTRNTLLLAALLGVVMLVMSLGVSVWRSLSTQGKPLVASDVARRVAAELSLQGVMGLTIWGRNMADVDLLAWIIQYYGPNNLLWGRTFLDIPLVAIPRTLWPGKPTEVGVSLFQLYSGWTGVLNAWHPGAIGELYVNAQLPGVLLGMLALGALFARVEAWRSRHAQEPGTALLYAVFAIKFALMTVIMGFMMPAVNFVTDFVILSLGIWFVRQPGPNKTSERT